MNKDRIFTPVCLDRFIFCNANIWDKEKLLESYSHIEKVCGKYLFCFNDRNKFVYNSRDIIDSMVCLEILGYGIFLKPGSSQTNQDILDELFDSRDLESLLIKTYELAGRWILIVRFSESIYVVGDASCSKPIFYSLDKLGWAIGSFEYSIANLLGLKKSAVAEEFRTRFVAQDKGDWWCGDATAFADIKALLPNHFLDLQKKRAIRFWPNDKIIPLTCEQAYEPCRKILCGIFYALTARYKIALPVTCGLDSRLLLAASLPYRDRIFYFVARNSNLVYNIDVELPVRLFRKLGIFFTVIQDSEKESNSVIRDFISLFPESPEDRAKSFYRFSKNWPEDLSIVLNGAVNEAGCRYYGNRLFSITPEGLCDLAAMRGSAFARAEYAKWLGSASQVCNMTGYELLDVFYWEHRTGRWMTKLGNDFEFSHDPIYAFNSRQYLDICLRIKSRRKNFPDRKFYVDLIRYIAPEVLEVPINPSESFVECLIRFIKRTPLERYFRKVFYRWQGLIR